MKKPKLTDEQIALAILSQGNIRAAAIALGIKERTIYERKKKKSFQATFDNIKSDLIKGACHKLQIVTLKAISVLENIMTDKEAPGAVRVTAANCILSHSLKYQAALDFEERLNQLERNLQNE